MSAEMMRSLLLLAAMALASPAAADPVALDRFVQVEATAAPRSVSAAGTTVTVGDRRSDPDGRPGVTVAAAGRTTLSFRWKGGDPAFDFQVGIGALAPGKPASVVITAFTGGAHCCTRVMVIEPAGHGFRRISLGQWDGDIFDFPTDRNGDGITDFVFRDDAFLYGFGSYAVSESPPRVFNIRGGKAVDVSAERAMRPIFAADLEQERETCFGPASGAADSSGRAERRNPACAVIAADAARLGTFDLWWPRILEAYDRAADFGPRGCRLALARDHACPDGQEIEYRGYPSALRAFLRARGYLAGAR